jgi:hypothetical protein
MFKSLFLAVLLTFCLASFSSAEVRTYTKTVRQLFGGGQSPDAATRHAMTRAKREALEEAGTYLESMTVVRDAAVESDEIMALAAGVLKSGIVSRKNFMESELFGIEITARVDVDTGVLNARVKALLSDRNALTEIKRLRSRESELLIRLRELEEKNTAAIKGPDQQAEKELSLKFSEATDELEDIGRKLETKMEAIVRDVSQIRQSTARIEKNQEKLAVSMEKISKGFEELARQGIINQAPKTPEEYYSNARIYELRGDYGNARRMYMEYFRFELDFVDPHIRFQTFLKVQEGREGAREAYEYLKKNSKGIVTRFASLLLQDRETRINRFLDFSQNNPDFAPVYYELSREYSDARLPGRGLEDRRLEKKYLEKFLAAHKNGYFVRWFIDKTVVAECLADAEKRLNELDATMGRQLEKPVSVNWSKSNSGWSANIVIAETATEILYRMDSEPDFKSTGHTQMLNPQTGRPMPMSFISLAHTDRQQRLWIKYRDSSGREMGPWDFTLNPGAEAARGDKVIMEMTKTSWVSLRQYNGETLLYFTHLMSWRGGLSKVFYGINREKPDTELVFPKHQGIGTARITDDVPMYIKIPEEVKFVTVRVIYFDRTESEVIRFHPEKQ